MLTWGKERCRGALFITEKYFMFHFLSISVSWKTIYSVLTSYKMLILTVICHGSINVPMLFISSDVHVCKFRKEAIRVLNVLNGSDVTVVHMLLWHDADQMNVESEFLSDRMQQAQRKWNPKEKKRWNVIFTFLCSGENQVEKSEFRWTSREASRSYETASYKSKSASLTKKKKTNH